MSETQVQFWAIIAKIQTMADNSLRLTLDLPENATEQISILMEYKRLSVVADVTIKPKQEKERVEQDDTRHGQDESRKIKSTAKY